MLGGMHQWVLLLRTLSRQTTQRITAREVEDRLMVMPTDPPTAIQVTRATIQATMAPEATRVNNRPMADIRTRMPNSNRLMDSLVINNRTDKHLTAINIRRATQETTARLDLHSIAVTTMASQLTVVVRNLITVRRLTVTPPLATEVHLHTTRDSTLDRVVMGTRTLALIDQATVLEHLNTAISMDRLLIIPTLLDSNMVDQDMAEATQVTVETTLAMMVLRADTDTELDLGI